jgi:hypothetical protein
MLSSSRRACSARRARPSRSDAGSCRGAGPSGAEREGGRRRGRWQRGRGAAADQPERSVRRGRGDVDHARHVAAAGRDLGAGALGAVEHHRLADRQRAARADTDGMRAARAEAEGAQGDLHRAGRHARQAARRRQHAGQLGRAHRLQRNRHAAHAERRAARRRVEVAAANGERRAGPQRIRRDRLDRRRERRIDRLRGEHRRRAVDTGHRRLDPLLAHGVAQRPDRARDAVGVGQRCGRRQRAAAGDDAESDLPVGDGAAESVAHAHQQLPLEHGAGDAALAVAVEPLDRRGHRTHGDRHRRRAQLTELGGRLREARPQRGHPAGRVDLGDRAVGDAPGDRLPRRQARDLRAVPVEHHRAQLAGRRVVDRQRAGLDAQAGRSLRRTGTIAAARHRERRSERGGHPEVLVIGIYWRWSGRAFRPPGPPPSTRRAANLEPTWSSRASPRAR